MADYEIIAVRVGIGKGRSHRVDAVKIGESLFLADQIIGWISAGTHRFWECSQNEEIDVIVQRQGPSGRPYLTLAGMPPAIALSSLPRM